MLSLIFVALAAICDAIKDVLAHHFPRSIFRKRGKKWWNPKVSWKNKYDDWDGGRRGLKRFTAFSDAWQTAKTLRVMFVIAAIVVFPIMIPVCYKEYLAVYTGAWYVLLLVEWILVYQFFYKSVLRTKARRYES